MSIAVEHERFILTAIVKRKGILILFWISDKASPALSLGDGF
jgi:hypothetical protein